jgi:hypothetical protein
MDSLLTSISDIQEGLLIESNISNIIKDLKKTKEKDCIEYLKSLIYNICKYYENNLEIIEDKVEKISKILRTEFNVITEEDTKQRLSPQEFGYRSTHFILTIKESWLNAPNYRDLKDLKVEFQVRTILMHAWAEIEHKLAYKSESQVPDAFKRKLYRLSAKFEEADEQFEELRQGLLEYREKILEDSNNELNALRNKELNLDTFQILLDAAYPNRIRRNVHTARLLAELIPYNLTMAELVDVVDIQKPLLKQLDEKSYKLNGTKWAQAGAMRNALELSNDKYYRQRRQSYASINNETISNWDTLITFGRKALGNEI